VIFIETAVSGGFHVTRGDDHSNGESAISMHPRTVDDIGRTIYVGYRVGWVNDLKVKVYACWDKEER